MGFFAKVHETVKLIPEGMVMTYSDIAEYVGFPKRRRRVSIAMKFCPTDYQWHRVVRDDGRVVTGNLQVMLLQKEHVPFIIEGHVNLEKCRLTADELRLQEAGASFKTLPDDE